MVKRFTCIAVTSALALISACEFTVNDGDDRQANAPAATAASAGQKARVKPPDARQQMRDQARAQMQNLRFVVDRSDRQLRVFQGDRLIREEPVAIGKPTIPTPVGSWKIHRVDINPEWIPTNEPWAENRTRKAAGDPANPMGRARLVYRMPNTIHGTDDTGSLGKMVSHGSIRVSNAVVLELAEMLLRAGGAWEGPEWFGRMTRDRTRENKIRLETPVPVEVRE